MTPKLNDLLIHPRTRAEVELFIARPGQALLVIGQRGAGKSALSRALAARVLGAENLESYAYFLHLSRPKDKKDIPIDDVRTVLRKLRLKTPGQHNIRRIVFIEDAHLLSAEAQNALLKVLEEPAADTSFILSSYSDQAVLPTIASRAQRLQLLPVTLAQAQGYYSGQKTAGEIESAWQLSQGNAGLLHTLLFDSEENPLKSAVDSAKKLLQSPTYERLLMLDKLSKDKEQFAVLLSALSKVLAALHRSAVNRGTNQAGLVAGRRLIHKLQKALEANTSPRLVALELALNLKV